MVTITSDRLINTSPSPWAFVTSRSLLRAAGIRRNGRNGLNGNDRYEVKRLTVQINKGHLAFVEEAKQAFQSNDRLETYRNEIGEYIALRYGRDRDCIMVYELGQPIANFVQQCEKRPAVRNELDWFSRQMEQQLQSNEHKGGWQDSTFDFLGQEIVKNLRALREIHTTDDFPALIRRSANIANFAMMIADKVRRIER